MPPLLLPKQTLTGNIDLKSVMQEISFENVFKKFHLFQFLATI